MKYRVTTRGWIVFSLLGILLLYGVIQVGSLLFKDSTDKVVDHENQVESESSSDQNNIDSEEDSSITDEINTTEETDHQNETTEDAENSTDTMQDEEASSSDDTNSVVEEVIIKDKTEIIFEKNNFELPEASHSILDDWIKYLTQYDNIKIVIEGHINGYPYYDDGPYGLNISEKRAEVVKTYLVENGIEETRMQIINKGSTDQVVETDDISEHYKNRRAVIYIINE